MEQYEADMEVYEHANDLRELQKDLAREQYTLVTLNYFNGSQSSVVAEDVRGISITYFTAADVVRHPLVARIVEAYDRAQKNGEKRD